MPATPDAEPARVDTEGRRWLDVGTVVERDDAYLLLEHGCAEPFCQESRAWVNAQPPEARQRHGRLLCLHQRLVLEREEYLIDAAAGFCDDWEDDCPHVDA